MITVRQAILDDREAIFEFIRRAWPERWQYKIPHRWQWQFQDNPFRDAGSLPVWIAVESGRVVGQTGAMVEPVEIHGQPSRVAWSVDTMVLPEYRGRGIGTELQKANQDAYDLFMSVSMSKGNRRIKQRLGGVPLPPVPTLRLRLAPDAAMVRKRLTSASPAVAALATAARLDQVLAAGATTAGRVLSRRRDSGYERVWRELCFKLVERFGEDVTAFWNRIARTDTFAVPRTAQWMNWKFRDQPHMDHARWVVRHRGDICGCLVLRAARPPESNTGILADLTTDPADTRLRTALAAWGVRWLRCQGVRAVRALASSPPDEQALRSLGFRTTGHLTPMMHARGTGSASPFERLLLSYGDHDLDQFPLA